MNLIDVKLLGDNAKNIIDENKSAQIVSAMQSCNIHDPHVTIYKKHKHKRAFGGEFHCHQQCLRSKGVLITKGYC